MLVCFCGRSIWVLFRMILQTVRSLLSSSTRFFSYISVIFFIMAYTVSLIAGTQDSLQKLSSTFYIYHNYYTQHALFRGHSDSLLNSLILLHPERYFTVWPNDPELEFEDERGRGVNSLHNVDSSKDKESVRDGDRDIGNCGTSISSSSLSSSISYITYYFSSSQTRIQMQAYWNTQSRFPNNLLNFSKINLKFWEWNWAWWRAGKRSGECRLVRVKSLQWLLRRPFGEMWRTPDSDVEDASRKSGGG